MTSTSLINESKIQKDEQPRPDRLEEPMTTIPKLKDPLGLFFQVIYFLFVLFIPLTIYSIIESLFLKKPKSLKGKVVLVTGTGRGLGQGFALKFAELGCKVACVDIDETLNTETVQMINDQYPNRAKAYTCNVAKSNEIRSMKEAIDQDFGFVDILVNNAALMTSAPSITDFEDSFLNMFIHVNLSSHFFMIRQFLPDMIKRNEGHVVAIASGSAFFGLSKASLYATTKHAVHGLMDSLYWELEDIPNNKIKTSLICPYFVNTSALYSRMWRIRIPELSVSEVVDAAIAGIRLEKRIFTIPTRMYYNLHLSKFFPDRVTKAMKDIFYIKFNIPSLEFQKTVPIYKLLKESMLDFDTGFENA